MFHSTKYNERNRDADTVNACNYVLSGKRHVAGADIDLAGRLGERLEIYASYAFMPEAEVDESSGAAGTEVVGSRPGLTPRHSGTLWATYQLAARTGASAAASTRAAATCPLDSPRVRQSARPRFVTTRRDAGVRSRASWRCKFNLTNIANKHYAETLYRGHYVPGRPRSFEVTASYEWQ